MNKKVCSTRKSGATRERDTVLTSLGGSDRSVEGIERRFSAKKLRIGMSSSSNTKVVKAVKGLAEIDGNEISIYSKASLGGVYIPILFIIVVPFLFFIACHRMFNPDVLSYDSQCDRNGDVPYDIRYAAVTIIGSAGSTLITQAMHMLVVDEKPPERLKVLRLAVILVSLVSVSQQSIWISSPEVQCRQDFPITAVLAFMVECLISAPLILYMNLALDPFKDNLITEDILIISGVLSSMILFFAANAFAVDSHMQWSSFLAPGIRLFLSGSAKDMRLVGTLLAAALSILALSLFLLVRQSFRTYQVALIGAKMSMSLTQDFTSCASLIDLIALKASTRKFYSSLYILGSTCVIGIIVFLADTNRLSSFLGMKLASGRHFELIIVMSFTLVHTFCLMQLAYHCQMVNPYTLAHAAEHRANESRRAFLKYVFMEVRAPLNSIMMSLHLLHSDPEITGESAETVAVMKEAAQFMAQTLNDVFSMQRIEEGKLDVEYGECEVDAILRTTSNSMQGQLAAKQIHLLFEKEPGVPAYILADRGRLEHVLVNMVSNAIKFSEVGQEVRVVVSLLTNSYLLDKLPQEQQQQQQPEVDRKSIGTYKVINFSVFDNGVGVKKEDQNRLFEAYTQIRPGELQGGRGTGVGLAICKQIIAKHDGLIGLRSDPSKSRGSEFYFSIPVRVLAHLVSPSASQASLNAIKGPLGSSTKVITNSGEEAGVDGIDRDDAAKLAEHVARFTTRPKPENEPLSSGDMGTTYASLRSCLKVMVVDDVHSNRKLLNMLLTKQYGVNADEVSSGVEALRKVREAEQDPNSASYDIIFLDNVMPALNGIATSAIMRGAPNISMAALDLSPGSEAEREVHLFRQAGVVYRNLLVGLTGNAMDEDLAEFHDAGADMTIGKPLKTKLLTELFRFCGEHGCGSASEERAALKTLRNAGQAMPEPTERLLALAGISEGPPLIPA